MLFPEETGTCISSCQPQLLYYPRHLMHHLQKWLSHRKTNQPSSASSYPKMGCKHFPLSLHFCSQSYEAKKSFFKIFKAKAKELCPLVSPILIVYQYFLALNSIISLNVLGGFRLNNGTNVIHQYRLFGSRTRLMPDT